MANVTFTVHRPVSQKDVYVQQDCRISKIRATPQNVTKDRRHTDTNGSDQPIHNVCFSKAISFPANVVVSIIGYKNCGFTERGELITTTLKEKI